MKRFVLVLALVLAGCGGGHGSDLRLPVTRTTACMETCERWYDLARVCDRDDLIGCAQVECALMLVDDFGELECKQSSVVAANSSCADLIVEIYPLSCGH